MSATLIYTRHSDMHGRIAILIAWGQRLRRQARPHVRVWFTCGNTEYMHGSW